MSRHSKNNTAHSIFTYHERQMLKDFGTIKTRLGEDSMRKFEQCWLCLRTAVTPVVTKQGFIFCKKCILLNFGQQKVSCAKKRKAYQEFSYKANEEATKRREEKAFETVNRFIESEEFVPTSTTYSNNYSSTIINGKVINTDKKTPTVENTINSASSKREDLRAKSFWIAENTPSSTLEKAQPPSLGLKCPISNAPLKLKDLKEINPECLNDDSESSRWICSISKKIIAHQQAVLIVPTKQLALKDYVEKYVVGQKGFSDHEITNDDIIPIIQGGSAFSSHNKVESGKKRPTM